MIQVTIIGTGALAKNLVHAFVKCDQLQLQIIGRSNQALSYFSNLPTSTTITDAEKSDIILLAVSDSAIEECANTIGKTNAIIAHCAGSLSIEVLQSQQAAVFYPLQTFNNNTMVPFDQIPILIEAKDKEVMKSISSLARMISNDVRELNSLKRKQLHLAAVFANNFSNYLFGVSKDLLSDFELPTDLLHELILQTAKNAVSNHPKENQSGPAKRNDTTTIDRHLAMIVNPEHKKLYRQLTNAIIEKYHEL